MTKKRGPYNKTTCINGHDRTAENTYTQSNGSICCRVCRNDQQRFKRPVRNMKVAA